MERETVSIVGLPIFWLTGNKRSSLKEPTQVQQTSHQELGTFKDDLLLPVSQKNVPILVTCPGLVVGEFDFPLT